MSSLLLSGYLAKVERAKEHLGVLEVSVNTFVTDRNAYSVIKEVDAKAGVFTFRLKLHKEPPLVEWSLVLGDCIHNMRSALDHLFWALVLLKHPHGVKGASSANFPILRDPNTFKSRKSNLENWVGKGVAAMLENMQPYQGAGPDKNGLLFIHECDITDKHKLLVPLAGIAERGELVLKRGNDHPSPHVHTELLNVPMEDGAVIARITVAPAESVMDVDFNPTIGIILNPDGVREDVMFPSLADLLEILASVYGDFAPLFQSR